MYAGNIRNENGVKKTPLELKRGRRAVCFALWRRNSKGAVM